MIVTKTSTALKTSQGIKLLKERVIIKKWPCHFFMGGHSSFERGLMVLGAVWAVAVAVWAVVASMQDIACDVWAMIASMLTIAVSMWPATDTV